MPRNPKHPDALFSKELRELPAYFESPTDPRLSSSIYRKTEEWLREYRSIADKPAYFHDEPWLTLTALYGLLGDQGDLDSKDRLEAVNGLFGKVYGGREGSPKPPRFSYLAGARMEIFLRENPKLGEYLKDSVFKGTQYHPYKDRSAALRQKFGSPGAGIEGTTHIDAVISGTDESDAPVHVFIETKFMSDISTTITYLPIRNQIARSIDCILDTMTNGGNNKRGIGDFWFVLLTPGMFRTQSYGGPVPGPFDVFQPNRSRLYCFKMSDYTNPELLKHDLAHWDGVLDDEDWAEISRRIGWMTFEELLQTVESSGLVENEQREAYFAFFRDRMLYP